MTFVQIDVINKSSILYAIDIYINDKLVGKVIG
jgi:hypothetical protein